MKIFFAAPFTNKINAQTGVVEAEFRQQLTSLYQYLREQGHTVMSAHEREEWGNNLMSPHECTTLDFAGIRECDLLMTVPGNPASGGVHMEIGYAAAHGKPIIQILDTKGDYTPLIHGLHTVTTISCLYFRHSVIEVLPNLQETISNLREVEYIHGG